MALPLDLQLLGWTPIGGNNSVNTVILKFCRNKPPELSSNRLIVLLLPHLFRFSKYKRNMVEFHISQCLISLTASISDAQNLISQNVEEVASFIKTKTHFHPKFNIVLLKNINLWYQICILCPCWLQNLLFFSESLRKNISTLHITSSELHRRYIIQVCSARVTCLVILALPLKQEPQSCSSSGLLLIHKPS